MDSMFYSELGLLPSATDLSCPVAPEGFEHIATAADEAMRHVLHRDMFEGPVDPRFDTDDAVPCMELVA